MRRYWAKAYSRSKKLEPNKRVLAEVASRARYFSDASVKVRLEKEEYMRERVLRMTGIDLDRVFKKPKQLDQPNEPRQKVLGHIAFIKEIEERGSRYDHHISLQDGAFVKVMLFYSVKWDKCFFVKVDTVTEQVQFSIRYNSRHRAFQVYRDRKITWMVPA